MTRKHKFYFFFWKLYLRMKGIKKGTLIKEWNPDKKKYIHGAVTSLSGDSVSNKYYGFEININFFEPVQGYDSRFFAYGSYSYNDFKLKMLKQ